MFQQYYIYKSLTRSVMVSIQYDGLTESELIKSGTMPSVVTKKFQTWRHKIKIDQAKLNLRKQNT